MNKKIAGIAVVLLAAVMLATPMVGMVAAAPKTELSFQLYLTGFPIPTPDGPKEADGNSIVRDNGFAITPETFVLIDAGPNEELITAVDLEYSAILEYQSHKNGHLNVIVRETIFIYESNEEHIEENLRGTLEIKALGTNKAGNGGTFVGFGTDDFEGVKVMGISAPLVPPPPYIILDRTGTVTGWPT